MKKACLLCLLLAALCATASEYLYLSNDFEGEWKPAAEKVSTVDGVRAPLPVGYAIVPHENGSGHYLHLERTAAGLREIPFMRLWNIPDFHNYRLHLRCRATATPAAYMLFSAYDNQANGGFAMKNGHITGYDANRNWIDSNIALPPEGEWFDFDIRFDVSQKCYAFQVTRADGTVQKSDVAFPFLLDRGIRKFVLGNAPPESTSFDVDDLQVFVENEMVTANRVDGTKGAVVTVNGQEIAHEDGVLKEPLRFTVPAKINITFLRPVPLCSLLLHLQGKTPNLNVEFYGMDAAGSGRQQLLKRQIVRGEEKTLEENFVRSELQNAEIVITAGDSCTIGLRSLQVLGALYASQGEKAHLFRSNLEGEFRAAYWQTQSEANLHLFNKREDGRPMPVRVSAATRDGKEVPQLPERQVVINKGEHVVSFPLEGLAAGEYVITVADDSGESNGTIRRVLRYFPKFAEAPRPEGPISMTGKKMLFPDGPYFSDEKGFAPEGGRATVTQVLPWGGRDDEYSYIATAIARSGGKVFIDYYTLDRAWSADGKRYWRATTDDLAANKWTVQRLEGRPSWHEGHSVRVAEHPPKAAEPDWDYKGTVRPEKFQFYDPAKHGPIDIHQLKFRYSGAVANNTIMWKNSTQDWGCMQAIPRATYKIWRRSPTESLVVDPKPMLTDKPPVGDIEDADATHDNFVGQWLSDDGKALYFAHARWLKANAPYNTPAYDNMDGLRLVNIWKTSDGLSYEQTVLTPPTEEDDPASQQYGATVVRLRQANGLFLAFVLRYKSTEQAMDIALAYSWDGGCWNKVEGPVFAENGPFGSFDAGCINVAYDEMHPLMSSIEEGNDVIQILGRVDAFYHFQAAQITCFVPDVERVTADFLHKTLGPRGIEKWPFFQEAGGYEGLADHCHKAGGSLAYARYRKDGWFKAVAGAEGAEATTLAVTAKGRLLANVKVGANGHAEFALVDAAGKAIEGFTKRLEGGTDAAEAPLFDTLPAQPFRVRLQMADAELYSLIFAGE